MRIPLSLGAAVLALVSSALAADAPANVSVGAPGAPAPPLNVPAAAASPNVSIGAPGAPAPPVAAPAADTAAPGNTPGGPRAGAPAAAAPEAPPPVSVPTNTVVLDALDKISGRVQTISGPVGQTLTFGNLHVVARACLTHPPEESPENSAFLEITQLQGKESPKQVFSGWMFSSNPAISAMDNPVYDVWVLACENRTAAKSP